MSAHNHSEIRLAQPMDCNDIIACINAAYSPYVERIGKRPAPMLADYASLINQSLVYVLSDTHTLYGVLVLNSAEITLRIENLAVHPLYQKQGFGRMMLDFAEQEARERGCCRLQLYTNEAVTESLAFYHRSGFRETGRREEDGYRRVFMQKEL